LGLAPERDASRLPTSPARLEGAPEAALDGTERRRQCPPDAQWHKEHYSGKKKTHTEKNLLLGNERTSQVLSLGPTIAGRTHAKKAADEAQLASPTNATLDKATGVPGDEPERVRSAPPKKSPQARPCGWASACGTGVSPRHAAWWNT
jgi:hypothetical protein